MESALAGRTHQFLRSEYIQPPPGPPSLDAKKSPLALLAQTCSAIGKEGPTKTAIGDKFNDTSAIDNINASTKLGGSSESLKNDNFFVKKSFYSDALKSKDMHHKVSHSRPSSNTHPVKDIVPTRKLSAPVFSKSDMVSVPRPHRTSPTILMSPEQNQISRRTLASTPMGASDDSSPDIVDVKKTADNHREYSPIRSKGNDKESESNSLRRNARVFCGRVNEPDVALSTGTTTNVSPLPSQYSQHSNKCGCTKGSESNGCKSEHSLYNSNSFKPTSYPLLSSGCLGCQMNHTPGSCEDTRMKEAADFYYPIYPMESTTAPQMGLQSAFSYNRLQSQIMAAAMAARNEYLATGDTNSHGHICKWVTATEGHCGKVFSTTEGLVEHLSTHALPPTSVNNFPVPSFPQSSLAAYFSGSAFSNPPAFGGISNNLTQVALANERFLQSSQRRCNPLNRYNPYKSPYSNSLNSYVPIFPPNVNSAGLYNPPYSFYGQPVGATASGYLYP